jgi:hypothetical protein
LVGLISLSRKITESSCSTYIYMGADNRATLSDIVIYVGSVPTEHLDAFDPKLHESFRRIVKDGIDLQRMKMVIDRDERQVPFNPSYCAQLSLINSQFRSKVESHGGDAFATTMIGDFLYGRSDGSQIKAALDEITFYNTLRTWSNEQWTDFIQKCVQFVQTIIYRLYLIYLG